MPGSPTSRITTSQSARSASSRASDGARIARDLDLVAVGAELARDGARDLVVVLDDHDLERRQRHPSRGATGSHAQALQLKPRGVASSAIAAAVENSAAAR